jgi:hypothetical protein
MWNNTAEALQITADFRAQGKREARAGRYSELQMQQRLKDAEGETLLTVLNCALQRNQEPVHKEAEYRNQGSWRIEAAAAAGPSTSTG